MEPKFRSFQRPDTAGGSKNAPSGAALRCCLYVMTVTIELPDDIAEAFSASGDLSRHALEVLAVDAYRQKALTQAQASRLLGLPASKPKRFSPGTSTFTTTPSTSWKPKPIFCIA